MLGNIETIEKNPEIVKKVLEYRERETANNQGVELTMKQLAEMHYEPIGTTS